MNRTVFLSSGEGTSDEATGPRLARTSPRWAEAAAILNSSLGINLDEVWAKGIGRHRCPESPLLTVVAEICMADLWRRWGWAPDVVVGHSMGELPAAYEAGFYSLEEVLRLTWLVGQAAAKVEGAMAHGTLPEAQLRGLPVAISSRNFRDVGGTHVTVSGPRAGVAAFVAGHPDFSLMRPPHPWHHPSNRVHRAGLDAIAARPGRGAAFVSGVTGRRETALAADHWQRWLSEPVDFIAAIDAVLPLVADAEAVDVIEMGFHPVLEKTVEALPRRRYVSSMYRGEDEIGWAMFQRRKLDAAPLLGALRTAADAFRPGIDFHAGLAYQGFTSRTFVEFSAALATFFPCLAPQDFYRHRGVQDLVERFAANAVAGAAGAPAAASGRAIQKREVVIAGMSCRFPTSADTPARFWAALQSRVDHVRPDPARGAREAGYLDEPSARFDHEYFGISEAEAASMDPQQTLALELTEMLWKDAGVDPSVLDKRRIGVYLGLWNSEYRGDRSSVYFPTGTNPSIVASRVSRQYDLRGPSWVVNTACSSSLVALHYACKDIEAGRVDWAIAGGVNMILGGEFTESMRVSGFLAEAQRCKAFDDSAGGYVRAEGGGLVLLAARDLVDKAYAVVRGSAVNQNGGRTQVITAPHPEAQEEIVFDACAEAGIEPKDLDFVECHGTGTRIGDPIEVSALRNTVARGRAGVCWLGSVKSNIGHLESAAGIAGLIKAVLALCHGEIPPNLHFDTPNRFIDFAGGRLQVVTQSTPISRTALVGVSSFGFGGVNAHVVLAGVEDAVRKPVVDVPMPFDRARARPLTAYYTLGGEPPQGPGAGNADAAAASGPVDIRALVEQAFTSVTRIKDIDPSVPLTDQGLDSLGTAQFATMLQQRLGVEVSTDLLFDYPLVEDLVAALETLRAG